MSKITTSLRAVEWRVTVADVAAPWNSFVVGSIRQEPGPRFLAMRGSLVIGNYATRDGAKKAVISFWQKLAESA